MASPSELTLEYKPNPLIQKTFCDQPEPTSEIKLQDFLARLEEEKHKIDAFKRELPLCMQLLNNGIYARSSYVHVQYFLEIFLFYGLYELVYIYIYISKFSHRLMKIEI